MVKKIYIYGDSNVYGYDPRDPFGGNYPDRVIWTNVLQTLLGDSCHVIADGMNGRVITQEGYSLSLLKSHLAAEAPLSMFAVMLGTNDMKQRFNLLPVDIAYGAAELGKLVESFDYGPGFPTPKVLLVCPIELGEGIEDSVFTGFASSAVEVSRKLPYYFEKQAKAHGWLYLNAAEVAGPSKKDMLHMEQEDHLALAKALEKMIREYFGKEQ